MIERSICAEKAKQLVEKMTVEEKASQLLYNSPAIKRLGIPEYNWWNEALHGVARAGTATVFPQAVGLAATFDTKLAQKVADAVSTEGRAKYNEYSKLEDRDIYKGLTYWSPNINIFRDPHWGRGHETFGEDPCLTAGMGVAYVKGLQGDGKYLKLAACAKHFAVHSGPESLRHEFNAEVSQKELYETYLPAFKALSDAGVEAFMGAYNRTNGEPCCGSKTLLIDILRDKWNFEGHVVSDCWAIRDFHEHHRVTASIVESAAMALKNGCDLNCGITYMYLLKAYEDGLITEADLTLAAERVFTTRYMLGLFDEEGTEYDNLDMSVVECKEHLELAKKVATQGCVLLKNNGVLPLDKSKVKTIGVVGPNADSRVALIGNYYGTASRYITVLEGIQRIAGDDIRVMYSEGCDISKNKVENLAKDNDRISEALIVAAHSDVVVVCTGLNEHFEGEEGDEGNNYASGDKNDLMLPESQRVLLEALKDCGKPVILVNLAGSSIDLSFADENFDAVMQAWYPGESGGDAVAEILFGMSVPGGKLPVTFYRQSNTQPDFTDYSMKGRTYRFMTEKPLYPFGYGLGYSDVKVVSAKANSCDNSQGVCIEAEIENTGSLKAEETVQVYVKVNGSSYAVPNPQLCGFEHVSLNAGEKKQIKLVISESKLMVVDDNGDSKLDGSDFTFFVGTSQPDERSRELVKYPPIEISYKL